MIRMYKYRAFAPRIGRDAFAAAVQLKREMWRDLCAMQANMQPRFDAARAAKDADATATLRKQRIAAIADIRRNFARRGLAWGDYNAVVFQFDGAVRASAARGALPGDHDGALGEAVVRQIMGDARPHHLLSRNDVCLEYLAPNDAERRRRPGSRRSKYRTARLDFQVRTDRNPIGQATLTLDFVMHRPLPIGCRVVEVRVFRTMKPVIRADGSAGRSERWHVCFAVRVQQPERADLTAAGVALDWSSAGELGSNALVVAYDNSTHELVLLLVVSASPRHRGAQTELRAGLQGVRVSASPRHRGAQTPMRRCSPTSGGVGIPPTQGCSNSCESKSFRRLQKLVLLVVGKCDASGVTNVRGKSFTGAEFLPLGGDADEVAAAVLDGSAQLDQKSGRGGEVLDSHTGQPRLWNANDARPTGDIRRDRALAMRSLALDAPSEDLRLGQLCVAGRSVRLRLGGREEFARPLPRREVLLTEG